MATTFLTDFNASGILDGRPYQEISAESATQIYPVGTILNRHGRRFRYCRAYEAITITHRGCPNVAQYPWVATSLTTLKGVSVNAFLAGDKQIVFTGDDYIEDTSPYNSLSPNYFAGGYIACFFDTNRIGIYRVTGSTASKVNGSSAANIDITLYLDEPIAKDYAAGCTVDLYCSPYMNVGASGSLTGWSSVVCIPQCAVTSGYWFWGQTAGPCWVTPTSGITGTTIRQVYFHSDGTIKDGGTDTSLQMAGYILFKGDNTQDDAMIQLMLE